MRRLPFSEDKNGVFFGLLSSFFPAPFSKKKFVVKWQYDSCFMDASDNL